MDETEPQSPASDSEPEHVPLSAAEARRTLKGNTNTKEPELGVDAVAKRQKKEKAQASKGGKVPKGKRRVQKERTFVNERGRTGKCSLEQVIVFYSSLYDYACCYFSYGGLLDARIRLG